MRTRGLPHGEFGTVLNDISDSPGVFKPQPIVLLKPGNDVFVLCQVLSFAIAMKSLGVFPVISSTIPKYA